MKIRRLRKFMRSKRALALPVTFLILFVATMGMVAFTYYFAVERVNAQGATLKVSTANQNMLGLDEAVVSTLWQQGSQATYEVADSGGKLNILPNNCTLSLTTVAGSDSMLIFNGSVGEITYELPYQSSSDTGLYLKGDERPVTNQSGASISQICIAVGKQHPEIQLRYRPSVTYAYAGEQDGKPVTDVRIYIANLNTSTALSLPGKLPLQAVCQKTQLLSQDISVGADVESIRVNAVLDGKSGYISVPVTTSESGGTVHLELVFSNVSVERWIR